jgi:hypothetical protein
LSKDYAKLLIAHKRAVVYAAKYNKRRKKRLKRLKKSYFNKIPMYRYKKVKHYRNLSSLTKKHAGYVSQTKTISRAKFFFILKHPAHIIMEYIDAKFDCTVIRVKLYIERLKLISKLIHDIGRIIRSKKL